MNEQLKVYASPLPFSNAQQMVQALPGSSLQQIVDNVIPDKYKTAGVGAVVMVNGEIIPMQHWKSVRPKIGTLVNVRVVPTGGGGGKKNPIATLLSIAVLVAAPYVAGAILGPTLAATQVGIGSLTYGGLLSSAIGVVGRLAISQLAGPPKPSNSGFDRVSNPTESPTQFIEGAKNSLNPFGTVPVNLGVNRMFPLQAARPYTETEDNDQYVRQLFTYGYGQEVVISDLKIGESALDDFNNFEIEHKLNGNLHEGTELFSNDVYQEDLSVLVEQSGGYVTRTTQTDADEVVVDITFPRGLASYNSQGKRQSRRVKLELQYAETGVSPQVWSPAASAFTTFAGATKSIEAVTLESYTQSGYIYTSQRIDIIAIDRYSGAIRVVKGTGGTAVPSVRSTEIRIAKVTATTSRDDFTGVVTSDITVEDIRDTSKFGVTLEDSSSFVPTKASSSTVDISSGGILVNDLDITGNQREALRRSVRIRFPAPGQYDLRLRRLTADSSSDQIFDQAYLTAIKTVKHQQPVNLQGINGTAMRIKATDQLNGALDQYNVICGTVIPDYDHEVDDWVDRVSSNPASLYRYVLQGAPNGKALADSKIDIADLEDWHIHCVEQGYTYNRVIDYDTSVDEILRDICAAGAASPAIVDGKRTIAIDRVKDDIVQIITPRNSWGYTGEMVYPELAHAFRVQFRNADKGYAQDERVVYDDGYDENNATVYETLEYQSCTNGDLAFKHGRRHIASARLRPETHTWMMDVENLVALRGNRVKLEHDVPLVGIGDGRIKTVTTDGGSPELVTGFTIDDTITIPALGTYYVRIRLGDGTQLYKQVTITTIGDQTSFTFAVPFTVDDTPAAGDLCYFVEAGGELDLIVTRIEPQDDLTARMSGINYAQPQIDNAEKAAIPAFDSKVTTPLEFIRPVAPVLLDEQSDEGVMLLNSDGTFTPRAVFTLENRNEGDIITSVKVRVAGVDDFTNADVLESTPERLVITGLEDGKYYDIHIRYRRPGGTMFSKALELNNYLFVGASGSPSDPTNFKVTIDNNTAFFEWDKNTDIDHAYSTLRFSGVFSGATYGTAQVLKEKIYENRFEMPFIPGTYLLKHVDLTGNDSDTAAAIITYDPGVVENAVTTVTENPDFTGVTDDTTIVDNAIILADPDVSTGYYYFANDVDLTDVFPCFVSATIVAGGTYINDVFDITDVFDEDDIFGAGGNDVFDFTDVFGVEDVFGIGNDAWEVVLEYRTTEDDPAGSPVTWTDWAEFQAGNLEFRGIQFRLKLTSLEVGISPRVTQLSVTVDMPDRIERGEDLTVPVTGASVTFTPEFKETPAIAITIQDGATDDKIEYVSKTAGGFSFKVYNDTAGDYVERSCDYIASGYGRKTT